MDDKRSGNERHPGKDRKKREVSTSYNEPEIKSLKLRRSGKDRRKMGIP